MESIQYTVNHGKAYEMKYYYLREVVNVLPSKKNPLHWTKASGSNMPNNGAHVKLQATMTSASNRGYRERLKLNGPRRKGNNARTDVNAERRLGRETLVLRGEVPLILGEHNFLLQRMGNICRFGQTLVSKSRLVSAKKWY